MTKDAIIKWKQENKEKHNSYNRESYAKNKAKYAGKRATYYQEHREKLDEQRKKRILEKRKSTPADINARERKT